MLNRIPYLDSRNPNQRGGDNQHSKGVFVGDLSSFCTEKDLYDLFARFGRVSAIEIKRGRHGDSLLHGFVEYESEQAASTAIQAMNRFKYKGRRMRYAHRRCAEGRCFTWVTLAG
jgi:RNA recognition motif-containing protein